jgi:hypothetical protein
VPDYNINLEDKFGSLRLIDVAAEAAAVADEWVNQTLTTVNDSVVRLGVVEGDFHWHKHVPACCTDRRREMPIRRHFREAL